MINQEEQQELLQMIKDNEGIIFKICNSYCSNKNDREDLAQEIIYQVLKSYHSFNHQFKFSTWMYRVALNVAISFYRKNKTISSYPDHSLPLQVHIENMDELGNNLSMLHRFIHELKELDKALMLLYLESKSYKEISEIIGITETNVATKINRIKASLKQKFSVINQ